MDINTMRAVLNTLEKVSVSGKENHGYILGLIQLFEAEIAKEVSKENDKDPEDGGRDGD